MDAVREDQADKQTSWEMAPISIRQKGYTANVRKHANKTKTTHTHNSHARGLRETTLGDGGFNLPCLRAGLALVQRLHLAYTELYALSTFGQKRLVCALAPVAPHRGHTYCRR